MNLKHLSHWLALAETGSFSRAAEKLHITQSALSRSIQVLEDELGGPLVDRIGKKNELTPLGLTVLERARRIVHEAAELKQGAALLQQGGLGSLRVGLGSGPGALLMTPWLRHVAVHHPGVQVSIGRGATELQLQQLRERELDALVVDVRRVAPAADLQIEVMADLRAGFVCRKGHPLLRNLSEAAQHGDTGAMSQTITFEALLAYPIASTPLSDEVARILVAHYGAAADPQRMTTLRCEEIASLMDTVRHTDAVYLGIIAAAQHGLKSGELVEMQLSPAFVGAARLALVTLAGRTEAPMMAVFRRFVAQQMQEAQAALEDREPPVLR
ncbi:LysR family transcriptional regulator [Limnohabitans sp. DM1]|uniref:LysR family transcriptional regulator n=1 Tax=Limnohabitans sp. DM1 TaxID=1597955 RepID=UPI000AA32DD6|nr:LysR family transcriptional regulator [Limnohabitans sp. DM1]